MTLHRPACIEDQYIQPRLGQGLRGKATGRASSNDNGIAATRATDFVECRLAQGCVKR